MARFKDVAWEEVSKCYPEDKRTENNKMYWEGLLRGSELEIDEEAVIPEDTANDYLCEGPFRKTTDGVYVCPRLVDLDN